jgi:AraC-like DNA-binding protein
MRRIRPCKAQAAKVVGHSARGICGWVEAQQLSQVLSQLPMAKAVKMRAEHDFGAGLLRRMQSGPPIERLMLDDAALGVACHLLRAHSTLACLAGAWTLSAERLRVNDFIDDTIAVEFGLGDLPRANGMPWLDLVRSFASADTGELHGYLNGRRIERARRLLRQSRMTTDEIAHAAGFKNVPRWTLPCTLLSVARSANIE